MASLYSSISIQMSIIIQNTTGQGHRPHNGILLPSDKRNHALKSNEKKRKEKGKSVPDAFIPYATADDLRVVLPVRIGVSRKASSSVLPQSPPATRESRHGDTDLHRRATALCGSNRSFDALPHRRRPRQRCRSTILCGSSRCSVTILVPGISIHTVIRAAPLPSRCEILIGVS
ncbi:hypothetical protein E2542_SST09120 [Spatholobus suberectus]|nr:hypothetical protein E2542_SST09120 [Spatholobus suberectus]